MGCGPGDKLHPRPPSGNDAMGAFCPRKPTLAHSTPEKVFAASRKRDAQTPPVTTLAGDGLLL